jgi:hypothetical protein
MPLIRILQTGSEDLLGFAAVFTTSDGSCEAVSGPRVQLSSKDGQAILSAIDRGNTSGAVGECLWELDGAVSYIARPVADEQVT